jgi:hypothetical protein
MMSLRIDRRKMLRWGASAITLVIAAGCGRPPANQPDSSGQTLTRGATDRGAYLVKITGCNDCHTTKKMGPNGPEADMSKMLAGYPEDLKLSAPPRLPRDGMWTIVTSPTQTAWSGPWGVSFAANLTPDQNTGMGIWTQEMFVNAMRKGRHMGVSRPILPPMPWQDLAVLSDADLIAVYTYLRTIPPIVNHVPDPIPADNKS